MSSIYDKKQRYKLYLITAAFVIGLATILMSNALVNRLADVEKRRVDLLREAYQNLQSAEVEQDLALILEIIKNNTTIPIIIAEVNDTVIYYNNINVPKRDSVAFLQNKLQKFKAKGEPHEFVVDGEYKQYLYYDESILLKRLSFYPFVQMGLVSIFILIAYAAFSNFRKAEENQVWVGLSKETAHQLGTPISSLMAWTELLKTQDPLDKSLLTEMDKDVQRLKMVAERFSKIGSKPDLEMNNLSDVLHEAVNYIKRRASKKVTIHDNSEVYDFLPVNLNIALFEWVIENVCKNAMDAMESKGELFINVVPAKDVVHIDIRDTGKGISKTKQKTIFNPGYTTKKRGWGLGLSLAKRIIENYHNGKIFVKQSEVNVGTTFRITLPLQAYNN